MSEMIFFGCVKEAGHYLHTKDGWRINYAARKMVPFTEAVLDSGLLSGVPMTEGLATISVIRGWTVVSFWDNSVDKRPNSNAAFIYHKSMTFEEMIEISREQLPWFWARFKSPIQLVV